MATPLLPMGGLRAPDGMTAWLLDEKLVAASRPAGGSTTRLVPTGTEGAECLPGRELYDGVARGIGRRRDNGARAPPVRCSASSATARTRTRQRWRRSPRCRARGRRAPRGSRRQPPHLPERLGDRVLRHGAPLRGHGRHAGHNRGHADADGSRRGDAREEDEGRRFGPERPTASVKRIVVVCSFPASASPCDAYH